VCINNKAKNLITHNVATENRTGNWFKEIFELIAYTWFFCYTSDTFYNLRWPSECSRSKRRGHMAWQLVGVVAHSPCKLDTCRVHPNLRDHCVVASLAASVDCTGRWSRWEHCGGMLDSDTAFARTFCSDYADCWVWSVTEL